MEAGGDFPRRPSPGFCIIILSKGLSVNRVMLPRNRQNPNRQGQCHPLHPASASQTLSNRTRHRPRQWQRSERAAARLCCFSFPATLWVPLFPAPLPCHCKRSCCPYRRGSLHLPFRLRIYRYNCKWRAALFSCFRPPWGLSLLSG